MSGGGVTSPGDPRERALERLDKIRESIEDGNLSQALREARAFGMEYAALVVRLEEAERETQSMESAFEVEQVHRWNAERRAVAAEERVKAAADFLQRLSEWDAWTMADQWPLGDANYWKTEIAKALSVVSGDTQREGKDAAWEPIPERYVIHPQPPEGP